MDPTQVKARFGEAVRMLRAEQGLSQEALALSCGLHRTYVGGIERGERNPSLINVRRIAAVLDVSAAQLMEHAGL